MPYEVSNMGNNMIKISKKDSVRGDDGYKTFSVRIKEKTVITLEELAIKTSRSRNELINILLEHSLNNVEVVE